MTNTIPSFFWRLPTSECRFCVILFGLCLYLLYFSLCFSDEYQYCRFVALYLQVCQLRDLKWPQYCLSEGGSILKIILFIRSERLLHKCTEINASNFLYSHFFFFASHGNVCTFLSLSFMKYNVLKTPCDTVNYFCSGTFGGLPGFFIVFVFLILRRTAHEYLGCTRRQQKHKAAIVFAFAAV